MGTKIKLTKQQMKEDKFTTFMLKTKDWFIENWQVVTIIGAVIILIIAGAVYYSNMKSGKEQEASERFAEAIGKFRQQNYQVAILDFNAIADEYSGAVAASAVFYVANAYYESKNYDEAISNYQKYIEKYHQDELTTASAIAGIAACLEAKQAFQGAAEKFREAASRFPDQAGTPDYLLGAVRNYVNSGMRDMAIEVLEELKENYSGTDQQRLASQLIMRLKPE